VYVLYIHIFVILEC